jgi:hypothetical protein
MGICKSCNKNIITKEEYEEHKEEALAAGSPPFYHFEDFVPHSCDASNRVATDGMGGMWASNNELK